MTFGKSNGHMSGTSRDLKGQGHDPNMLRPNISKTAGDAIQQQSL